MSSFTFIHTSDLQLGMTRHFLDPQDAGPRFAQDRIDAISKLGELAQTQGAQCILVAGDVFESNQLTSQTISRVVDAMRGLPVPILLLPGNHDPLDAASLYDNRSITELSDRIYVIRDQQAFSVPGITGVEFIGAPWFSKRPTGDLCNEMLASLAPMADGYRVAMAHGQTSDQSPDPDQPGLIDLAAAEAAVRDRRVHYLALGDRHSTTAKGSTGAIWYSGAPVATDFDETDPNQALLVTLHPDRQPEVSAHRIGQWLFEERHFEIGAEEDLGTVEAWFDTHPVPARTVTKLSFSGTVNLRTHARLEGLLDTLRPKYASLRIHQRYQDLVVAPDQFDTDTLALSGYAKQVWQELVEGAGREGEAARVDQDALALLYRLAGGAR